MIRILWLEMSSSAYHPVEFIQMAFLLVLAHSGLSLKDQLLGISVTLDEALMAPTVIYVKQVLDIISKGGVKGVAHITGGGFTDNIPRVFPKGLGVVIYNHS